MTTHTPGPWIASPFGDCAYEVMAPDGTVIAVIDGAPDESAVLEANARLIAAAPELLAALLTLKTCDLSDLPGDVVGMIDAAIAKATGET